MKSHHATGTFSVSMSPQPETGFVAVPAAAPPSGAALNRLLLDKQYRGDLQAGARGQMLSAVTDTTGSAGYVAIEQVSGSLQGREGSFVLQHSGLMDRGTPQLMVAVVPDSGTGGLLGLAGRLQIRIGEGQHFYDFDYTLP